MMSTQLTSASPGNGPTRSFSFVIANFNYARFIARAIESALAVDWPAKEIIVVDDGSTDGSRAVIDSFSDRIQAIYQANGGQRVANNTGFERSTGDLIVFLDADDIVEPNFAKVVAAAWRPGVSKIQVQMRRVDEQERPLGSLVPDLQRAPSAEEIRQWVMESTEYPTPPGSGNVYARDFLERFFPIGEEHDSFTDSTCLTLAPLFGDVVTVLQPLVLYRMHGSNDSNLLGAEGRFGREIARAIKRQKSATAICERLGVSAPSIDDLRGSRHLLQLRVASMRLGPNEHPLQGDGHGAALRDAVRSLFKNKFDPPLKRLVIAGWSVATLLAPRPLARRLIYRRFRQG